MIIESVLSNSVLKSMLQGTFIIKKFIDDKEYNVEIPLVMQEAF